jgi:hypothetical protein
MYRNHWVTSDVQFRKGASIPPFWVGNGYPDTEWLQGKLPTHNIQVAAYDREAAG